MIIEFIEGIIHLTRPEWINPNYWRYFAYLPLGVVGFLLTMLITPWIGYFAKKLGIENETRKTNRENLNNHENVERRINPNAVPLLGGIAVLIPFIVFLIVTFGFNPIIVPFVAALLLLLIGGILDDLYNLPATTQLLIQLTAAVIIAISSIDLLVLNLPIFGVINISETIWTASNFIIPLSFAFPGDIFMILWILILINAVKWVGGLDALMESNMIIAFLLLYVIAIRTNAEVVLVSSIFLFGSVSAFTLFNFPPAKIFTGSTGKTSYGFIIAVLSLINDTKVAVTLIILLLPLIDFIFVIIKRISIIKPTTIRDYLGLPLRVMRMPDTNHLHHKLLALGFSVKQILLIEVLIALMIGIVAVSTTSAYRFMIVLILGFILISGILLAHILTQKNVRIPIRKRDPKEDDESPESRYSY